MKNRIYLSVVTLVILLTQPLAFTQTRNETWQEEQKALKEHLQEIEAHKDQFRYFDESEESLNYRKLIFNFISAEFSIPGFTMAQKEKIRDRLKSDYKICFEIQFRLDGQVSFGYSRDKIQFTNESDHYYYGRELSRCHDINQLEFKKTNADITVELPRTITFKPVYVVNDPDKRNEYKDHYAVQVSLVNRQTKQKNVVWSTEFRARSFWKSLFQSDYYSINSPSTLSGDQEYIYFSLQGDLMGTFFEKLAK